MRAQRIASTSRFRAGKNGRLRLPSGRGGTDKSGEPMHGREHSPLFQLVRFCGVGLVAAVIHYGLVIVLVEALAVPAVPAALLGFVAGGIASYLLNRRFTFASERPHGAAAPRFALVAGGGFIITGAAMHVLVVRLGAHYLAAQVATTLVVMVWTFSLNRLWTFAARRDAA